MNVITKTDLKKATVWTNLLVGLLNLNTFVQHDSLFNLIIGTKCYFLIVDYSCNFYDERRYVL